MRGKFYVPYLSNMDKWDDLDFNCILMPSLKDMAGMSLVASIWKDPDLGDAISHYFNVNDSDDGQLLRSLEEKLSRWGLPSSLHNEVGNALLLLGHNIMKMIACQGVSLLHKFLRNHLSLEQRIQICAGSAHFDVRGSIINSKMLEILLVGKYSKHEDELFLKDGFELACTYCQDDLASLLWSKLSEDLRRIFIGGIYVDNFASYWTCYLNKDWGNIPFELISSGKTLQEKMFELSIEKGNFQSVEYFWSKLDDQQRNRNLVRFAKTSARNCIDYESRLIFVFLISQMNKHEKKEFLGSSESSEFCSVLLIALFLTWPLQSLVIPTFRVVLDSMNDNKLVDLISTIIFEAKHGNFFCHSASTLASFSHWIPHRLNDFFVDQYFDFFRESFSGGKFGKSNFQFMFGAASVKVREMIAKKAFSDINLIPNALEYDKFDILEYFIEQLTSETEIVICKESMASLFNRLFKTYSFWEKRSDGDRFWENAMKLFNLVYGTQDEILALKLKIETCHIVGEASFYDNYEDFTTFVNWYCDSSDTADRFRRNVDLKAEIRKSCLYLERYQFMDKFLDWYFCGSEEEKWRVVRTTVMSNVPYLMEYLFSQMDKFDIFVKWCFGSCEEQLIIFKAAVGAQNVIYHMLEYQMQFISSRKLIQAANKVLTWCFDSNKDEITKFKQDFLFSKYGVKLIELMESIEYGVEASHLAEWFKPFQVSAVDKFKDEVERHVASPVELCLQDCKLHDAMSVDQALRFMYKFSTR